ncbi:MAG: type II toxin-antitoxin system RelE family toxin [Elusimicrobiota bacterium]
MNKFRIFETDRFLKDLKKDFGGQRKQIKSKLSSYAYTQLKKNPYFGKNIKKLKNYNPETWRYRIGNYRFFYTINEDKKLVIMLTIDKRGNAY